MLKCLYSSIAVKKFCLYFIMRKHVGINMNYIHIEFKLSRSIREYMIILYEKPLLYIVLRAIRCHKYQMLKIESNENTKGTRNFSILQYITYFEKGKLQGYFLFLLNFLFCLQVSSLWFKWKRILTGPPPPFKWFWLK